MPIGARAIRSRIASRTARPSCRQHDVLDAPVLLAGAPRHEVSRLEAVDDAGHVRVVAGEAGGDLVHGQPFLAVELHQRACLRGVQVELGSRLEEASPLGEQKLAQQLPRLIGGRGAAARRGCRVSRFGRCGAHGTQYIDILDLCQHQLLREDVSVSDPAAIEVHELVREFRKGPRAVDGIDLAVSDGGDLRLPRAQRRRQVHDRADAHDAAAADERHARRWAGSTSSRQGSQVRSVDRRGAPGGRARHDPHRSRAPRRSRRRSRAFPRAAARSARRSCSSASGSPKPPIAASAATRAG